MIFFWINTHSRRVYTGSSMHSLIKVMSWVSLKITAPTLEWLKKLSVVFTHIGFKHIPDGPRCSL